MDCFSIGIKEKQSINFPINYQRQLSGGSLLLAHLASSKIKKMARPMSGLSPHKPKKFLLDPLVAKVK
jgi:hypothetical protein